MGVKSTVTLNGPRIKAMTQAAVVALEQTAEALHTEVDQAQVMPFDTGHLAGDATFVDYSAAESGTVSIISATPYARRLYYHPEYHFQQTENANAGGEWDKDWLPGGKNEQQAPEIFKKIFKKVSAT